jgi:hypothetical protein
MDLGHRRARGIYVADTCRALAATSGENEK